MRRQVLRKQRVLRLERLWEQVVECLQIWLALAQVHAQVFLSWPLLFEAQVECSTQQLVLLLHFCVITNVTLIAAHWEI